VIFSMMLNLVLKPGWKISVYSVMVVCEFLNEYISRTFSRAFVSIR